MTKTLTKICTVALMLMMSMSAMAIDIRIESFTGGEISATQGDEKDGKVTVTLTVIPYDGYTITKDDIYVYATISPSETRGNSPTISERISLDGKDPDDASEKRDYTFTITTNFGVWVKEANFSSESKGGNRNLVSDGIYYIQNNNSNTHGYLWPSLTTNTTTGYRYLTTSLATSVDEDVNTNGVSYPAHDKSYSHWVVKNVTGGYIQLINPRLNKYVVIRKFPKANNTKTDTYGDRDVWLTDKPATDDIEYTYFVLNNSNSPYKISPKPGLNSVNTTSSYSLNSASGDDRVWLTWSKSDNKPQNGEGREGLIQLHSGGTPLWSFTSDLLDAPTISVVDESTNTFTITDTNGLPEGYTIRYTTGDGTQDAPTADTGTEYTGPVEVTANWTVKAVVVRYGIVLTDVATGSVSPVLPVPIISFDNSTNKVSINVTSTAAIYYNTGDGTQADPTTSTGTLYEDPFDVTSPTTVKAISSLGNEVSPVTTLTIEQVATPTIQNNGSNAISITTDTPEATIYYTTDGTDPTTSSTEYSGPLTENVSNVTIKAIAVKEGMISSTVGSGSEKLQCATPVITRVGQTFTLSCSMPTDAALYYTLRGGSEVAYLGTPVPFDADQLPMTVTAVARHNDYLDSETASMELKNGEGTIDAPYLIYGTTDLTNFVNNVNNGTTVSACYKLVSDVSASGIDEITIGFTGVFDGNGYTISNLGHALFNTVNGGTVKNVILDNVSISGGSNVGAICNEATGDTRIYNCGVKSGTISGTNAGSIVGKLDGYSRVINCYSFATVSGGTWGAGIVGYNSFSSTISDLRTMVMNCMFYGEISSGTNISPIYGGHKITNVSNLNGYNYYRFDADYSRNNSITAYNCALAAEEKYLTRFEFFRNTLNSNRELAAWYAIGDPNEGKGIGNACEMAKWVLDIAEKPYPILKTQDYYPSVINYEDAPTLGTISLTIDESNDKPEGASINQDYPTTLTVYDKDLAHNHFNYRTVRLPYYNEVGTGNCTKNKVVTGWKITGFTDGTQGHFVKGVLDYSGTTHSEGVYPPYNFADRYCTDKDKYSVSGRVFSQGAYYDVPEGVTGITIEPYWGTAVYLSDPTYDVAYPKGYGNNNANAVFVSNMGDRYVNGNTASINGDDQIVYTNYSSAFNKVSSSGTIYDNAIVLVGNYHHYWGQNSPSTDKAYTVMSADLNNDCEPDYSFIVQHGTGRQNISAIRFDFINSPGLGMIQKVETDKAIPKHGIWCPKGWFEVTNTTLIEFTQFEYDRGGKSAGSPLILLGGIYDQFITARQNVANSTEYIHLGSNIWMKEFCNGVHTNASNSHTTRHIPISVTGGEFESFYLTGTFRPSVTSVTDNAECYINGGKFGDMAGAGQEQLKGDVTWLIDHADITNFYGGGINGQKPVTGNIYVEINNSQVELYCGGPKFGNMQANMKVTTKAKGSTFGNFYGAGYGGTSYFRDMTQDATGGNDWDTWVGDYTRKYVAGKGISTAYECEFIPYSGGQSGQPDYVGRFYVLYASLSLAETKDVESTLEDCNITGSFYGGGKLGRVDGNIISTLNNCTVGDNVYGAGFSASVEKVNVVPKGAKMNPNPAYNESVGVFTDGTYPDGVPYTWTQVASISAGKEFDDEKKYIYTTVDLTTLGTVTGNVTLTINGNTEADENGKVMTVGKSVYGGGEESAVGGNTNVNINAGKVMGNVYGGGNQANVGGNTLINLKGGIVANNVFGGGKGDDEHYATVGGNTDVKLNETVEDDNCIVNGNIFGCNDVNGTPLGNATVHIYKTNGDARTASGDLESIDDTKHKYHLNAVYGGGNLAAYIPTAGTAKASVIIDGCDVTSIRTVYGGGNAASTPATSVVVNGTYEIEEVFGGGNGKDALPDGSDNPGANVGFKNYSAVEATYDTKEKRQSEEFMNQYVYGSGQANVTIVGGRVHRVFGGSNTKGNVRITAVTMLDDIGGCHFIVDEAYGGGKSAPMDGEAKLLMSCIPGLKVAYGGAENANILGDVTLNITNGNFDRVFGGNNISGTIGGKITVNIEETGCSPIIIGQLYGGGNQAPYDANGQTGPTLNIKSFTSIGEVYGGGYGISATVTGDTHVNINEVKGRFTDGTHNYGTAEAPIGVDKKTGVNRPISFSEFVRNKDGEYLDADGHVTTDESERAIVNKTVEVYIPKFTANKIGGIGKVYGGGNEAEVVGNTHVNIGTQSTIDFVTGVGSDAPQTGVSVEGADIRGNIYGGGNNAGVTGNAEVIIGREDN